VVAVIKKGKEKIVAVPLPGIWTNVGPENPTAPTVTDLRPQGRKGV
jgi:hypothetical protein